MTKTALAFPALLAAVLAVSACAKGADDNVTVSNDIAVEGDNVTDAPQGFNVVDDNSSDTLTNAL